ncbi:MAG: hypothetical protein Q4G19_08015 [Clostridia bacterium]|nr:hypothetical protein [Clostridia bacterium]
MTKKRLLFAIAACLVLALLCVFGAAVAEDDQVKLSMDMSENQFTGPKEITVSITVTNGGDTELPGAVTLYYPSGKRIEEFGAPVLATGASKNWTGTWTVTESQLKEGKISFTVRYSVYDENGELKGKQKKFSKKITYVGAEPAVTINRTILPTTAQNGQEVTVTYEILNTGNVDITNVIIKENSGISSKSGTIESVKIGEKANYTFSTTMGKKDLTSAATVTYTAAGKTYTAKKESATIKYGTVKLTATLSADKKGGAPGETVKLTLKLKNSGTVDYTDVNVTDAVLGTVFSNQTVPAGETVTLEKDLTITESQDLQFIITAQNATGEPLETATGKVGIIATDPTQQIVLNVDAKADRNIVYQLPGSVRFTVTVANASTVDVKNVTVKAVDKTLYTFPLIAAGESKSFTRDVQISMDGQYQFTASCKDQLSQTLTFYSNILPIAYTMPTPVPTEAPIVTPPAPVYEKIPTDVEMPGWMTTFVSVSGTAKYIFGGVAAVLLVLLLIGAVRRIAKKKHSAAAQDHLERGSYRDYSVKPKGNKRNVVEDRLDTDTADTATAEGGEETPESTTVQDSELMAETLRRLYDKKPAEEAAEAVGEAAENAAEAVAEAAETAAEAAGNVTEEVKEAAEAVKADAKQVTETDARSFGRKMRNRKG